MSPVRANPPMNLPRPGWDLEEALAQQLASDKGPQDKKVYYNDSFSDVSRPSSENFVVGEFLTPPASGFRHAVAVVRSPVSGFCTLFPVPGLSASSCRSPGRIFTPRPRLLITSDGFPAPTSYCRLPASHRRLPALGSKFPASGFRLPGTGHPHDRALPAAGDRSWKSQASIASTTKVADHPHWPLRRSTLSQRWWKSTTRSTFAWEMSCS